MENMPFFDPGLFHFPAWVLFLFSFLLASQIFLKSPFFKWFLLFALLPRHALSIAPILGIPFPEAQIDAQFFHDATIRCLQGIVPLHPEAMDVAFFKSFLAFWYYVFGPSLFLGNQLAILFYLLALHKLKELFKSWGDISPLLFLFSIIFPSSFLFSTSTLREPFELFFIVLAFFYFSRFLSDPRLFIFLAGLSAGVISGLFHAGTMISYTGVIPLMFLLLPSASFQRKALFALLLVAVLLVLFKCAPRIGLGAPQFIFMENRIEAINRYREWKLQVVPSARTHYGLVLDNSSPQGFMLSFGSIYGHYLFSPFPWKLGKPADLIPCLEALFRLAILFLAIFRCLKSSPEKSLRRFFLLSYFCMTCVWALGTVNFGTAIRHHFLTNWLLLFALFPAREVLAPPSK